MSFTDQSTDQPRRSALVVYESMFGNTKAVAEAVALALASTFEVDLQECSRAPSTLPSGLALLVVGGPTHAFGLSRDSTREDARRQAAPGDEPSSSGLREWLDVLPRAGSLAQPVTAAFDTKVSHPRLPGSAAHSAAKRLHRLGYQEVAKPRTFFVDGSHGPLLDGETDAAFAWGRDLASEALLVKGNLPAL